MTPRQTVALPHFPLSPRFVPDPSGDMSENRYGKHLSTLSTPHLGSPNPVVLLRRGRNAETLGHHHPGFVYSGLRYHPLRHPFKLVTQRGPVGFPQDQVQRGLS